MIDLNLLKSGDLVELEIPSKTGNTITRTGRILPDTRYCWLDTPVSDEEDSGGYGSWPPVSRRGWPERKYAVKNVGEDLVDSTEPRCFFLDGSKKPTIKSVRPKNPTSIKLLQPKLGDDVVVFLDKYNQPTSSSVHASVKTIRATIIAMDQPNFACCALLGVKKEVIKEWREFEGVGRDDPQTADAKSYTSKLWINSESKVIHSKIPASDQPAKETPKPIYLIDKIKEKIADGKQIDLDEEIKAIKHELAKQSARIQKLENSKSNELVEISSLPIGSKIRIYQSHQPHVARDLNVHYTRNKTEHYIDATIIGNKPAATLLGWEKKPQTTSYNTEPSGSNSCLPSVNIMKRAYEKYPFGAYISNAYKCELLMEAPEDVEITCPRDYQQNEITSVVGDANLGDIVQFTVQKRGGAYLGTAAQKVRGGDTFKATVIGSDPNTMTIGWQEETAWGAKMYGIPLLPQLPQPPNTVSDYSEYVQATTIPKTTPCDMIAKAPKDVETISTHTKPEQTTSTIADAKLGDKIRFKMDEYLLYLGNATRNGRTEIECGGTVIASYDNATLVGWKDIDMLPGEKYGLDINVFREPSNRVSNYSDYTRAILIPKTKSCDIIESTRPMIRGRDAKIGDKLRLYLKGDIKHETFLRNIISSSKTNDYIDVVVIGKPYYGGTDYCCIAFDDCPWNDTDLAPDRIRLEPPDVVLSNWKTHKFVQWSYLPVDNELIERPSTPPETINLKATNKKKLGECKLGDRVKYGAIEMIVLGTDCGYHACSGSENGHSLTLIGIKEPRSFTNRYVSRRIEAVIGNRFRNRIDATSEFYTTEKSSLEVEVIGSVLDEKANDDHVEDHHNQQQNETPTTEEKAAKSTKKKLRECNLGDRVKYVGVELVVLGAGCECVGCVLEGNERTLLGYENASLCNEAFTSESFDAVGGKLFHKQLQHQGVPSSFKYYTTLLSEIEVEVIGSIHDKTNTHDHAEDHRCQEKENEAPSEKPTEQETDTTTEEKDSPLVSGLAMALGTFIGAGLSVLGSAPSQSTPVRVEGLDAAVGNDQTSAESSAEQEF
jgi:hypothetical protein